MSKFKAGEINNPYGRPKNSGHRQQLFNALVEPHKNDLINKAIQTALDGNEALLRFFLERLLPSKHNDGLIKLDIANNQLNDEENLFKIGENVLIAVASGDLTPDDGQKINSILKTHREALILYKLIDQIKELNIKVKTLESLPKAH